LPDDGKKYLRKVDTPHSRVSDREPQGTSSGYTPPQRGQISTRRIHVGFQCFACTITHSIS
jgi:hypothetical protein